MSEAKRPTINWLDVLMLAFLAGLALVPPVKELHKQEILLAFGVVQLLEGWLIAQVPRRGAAYVVLLKIALATLLIDHTGEIAINSSYWPIYILPAVTAAEYFGPWATLAWTTIASAAYCSYLFPALQEFENETEDFSQLALRVIGVDGLSSAGDPHSFHLSSGDGSQSLQRGDPPTNEAIPGIGRNTGGDESAVGAGPGRGAAIGAAGGAGSAFGRVGARDTQSFGSDQGIGGDADAETCRFESPGNRTGGLHFNRDEPVECLGHPFSGFRTAPARRSCCKRPVRCAGSSVK